MVTRVKYKAIGKFSPVHTLVVTYMKFHRSACHVQILIHNYIICFILI